MTNGTVRKWRKVLYEDSQGFEDNFTPTGSFLAAIEKNKGVRVYTRAECLAGAGRVGNEVRASFAFRSQYQIAQFRQTRIWELLSKASIQFKFYLNTWQVCCVLVFWSVHQLLLRKLLSPSSLLAAMALALLVLGLHRRLTLGSSLLRGLSTSLLFSIIGFALSPVLSKLTDSISTDTIHRCNWTFSFHFCWRKLGI